MDAWHPSHTRQSSQHKRIWRITIRAAKHSHASSQTTLIRHWPLVFESSSRIDGNPFSPYKYSFTSTWISLVATIWYPFSLLGYGFLPIYPPKAWRAVGHCGGMGGGTTTTPSGNDSGSKITSVLSVNFCYSATSLFDTSISPLDIPAESSTPLVGAMPPSLQLPSARVSVWVVTSPGADALMLITVGSDASEGELSAGKNITYLPWAAY